MIVSYKNMLNILQYVTIQTHRYDYIFGHIIYNAATGKPAHYLSLDIFDIGIVCHRTHKGSNSSIQTSRLKRYVEQLTTLLPLILFPKQLRSIGIDEASKITRNNREEEL